MRNAVPVGVILIGIGCVVYGIWQVLPAAAWIVGGVLGMILGVLMIAGELDAADAETEGDPGTDGGRPRRVAPTGSPEGDPGTDERGSRTDERGADETGGAGG